MIGLEPAPLPHRVRDGGLRRVRAQKVLLLGEFVHPHADREILDALPAAVRHHDQRQERSGVAGENIELRAERARSVDVGRVDELPCNVGEETSAEGRVVRTPLARPGKPAADVTEYASWDMRVRARSRLATVDLLYGYNFCVIQVKECGCLN